MGWTPADLRRPEVLVLSTLGRHAQSDGTPLALDTTLGTGRSASSCRRRRRRSAPGAAFPFAAFCTDPCDGRTQGTSGMLDSLAYRNDAGHRPAAAHRFAAHAQGRDGRGHLRQGPARDDHGPRRLPRPPGRDRARGRDPAASDGEDAGKADDRRRASCTGASRWSSAAKSAAGACASPGGGCQFLGTAATAQVIAEALGLALPTPALGSVRPAHLARRGAALRAAPSCAR